MIYLLSYLAVGAATLAFFVYAVWFHDAADRRNTFVLSDLIGVVVVPTFWPVVWVAFVWLAVNDWADSRSFTFNGDTVLWRRKVPVQSGGAPAPLSPHVPMSPYVPTFRLDPPPDQIP